LHVELQYLNNELQIIAEDNGVGFIKEETSNEGIGLQNIENRAKLIGARIDFQSTPEEGTKLVINYYF
jgi:signal transduction histidine kinase